MKEKRIFELISILLHPIFIPVIGALLIFYQLDTFIQYMYQADVKKFLVLIILLLTMLIPSMLILFLIYMGRLSDFDVSDRKQRWLPFLIIQAFYIGTYYILAMFNIHVVFKILMLSAMLSVFASFIITLFWKISIHLIGFSGLIGLIYGLAQQFGELFTLELIGLILLCGLLGVSRYVLKHHSMQQIGAGAALGFLFNYCFITYML